MGLSDAGLEVFPRYAVYHCHVHLARKSKTLIMEVRGLASSIANSLIRQVGALLTRFPPPSEKPEIGWQAGKVCVCVWGGGSC